MEVLKEKIYIELKSHTKAGFQLFSFNNPLSSKMFTWHVDLINIFLTADDVALQGESDAFNMACLCASQRGFGCGWLRLCKRKHKVLSLSSTNKVVNT
jgi:hypothetical protein